MIAVWDIKGRHLWDLNGHLGRINFVLPLGPRMWSGAQDGSIRVWSNGCTDCLHIMPENADRPTDPALLHEFEVKNPSVPESEPKRRLTPNTNPDGRQRSLSVIWTAMALPRQPYPVEGKCG